MNVFIPLLIASFSISISQLLNKTLSKKGHSPTTYTSITMLSNALIAIPLLFIQPHFSQSIFIWVLIIASATIYGLSSVLTFKAFKTTDVSIVSIIQRLSIAFISFMGITLLKESYTPKTILGIVLIVASSIILVYKKTKKKIDTGILMSLGSAFFGAIASILDKKILFDFSPYSYVFVNNALIGILFLFNKNTIKETPHLIKNHTMRMLGTSILNVLSFVVLLVVLKNTDVSQTMPVYKGLTLIITVLLGVLFLGEKSQMKQKILGTILGMIGIFLMY